MMKKTIAILLSLVMIFGLAACGNSASRTERSSTEENSVEITARMEESVEGSNTDVSESQMEETNTPDVRGSKVLVAYFSATGTTKGVAEHIANGLNADIYEIVPEDPYTDADLNFNDNNSRTTIEMNDPDARPAISGSVEDMDQYTTVFIGYPIWWGDAPRVINTFVESYDFSGKTIIPFCTSGGSGMGKTNERLAPSCPGAALLKGKMLNSSLSQEELKAWAQSL